MMRTPSNVICTSTAPLSSSQQNKYQDLCGGKCEFAHANVAWHTLSDSMKSEGCWTEDGSRTITFVSPQGKRFSKTPKVVHSVSEMSSGPASNGGVYFHQEKANSLPRRSSRKTFNHLTSGYGISPWILEPSPVETGYFASLQRRLTEKALFTARDLSSNERRTPVTSQKSGDKSQSKIPKCGYWETSDILKCVEEKKVARVKSQTPVRHTSLMNGSTSESVDEQNDLHLSAPPVLIGGDVNQGSL